jgi:hypothetical protein
MYLARYAFDGDPTGLESGYRVLAGRLGDAIALQVAVRRRDGFDVYDTCPSEAEFVAFSGSDAFRAALTGAGLPTPRIDGLGEIAGVVHNVAPEPARG